VATLRKLDGTAVREGELPAATGGANDSGNGGDTGNGGDSGEPPPDESGNE
jgi:hypothetical protein